eukprot:gene14239-biopygen3584
MARGRHAHAGHVVEGQQIACNNLECLRKHSGFVEKLAITKTCRPKRQPQGQAGRRIDAPHGELTCSTLLRDSQNQVYRFAGALPELLLGTTKTWR